MCTALLLKYGFARISVVQRINSLILYAGHSGIQVYMKSVYRVMWDLYVGKLTLQVFQRLQKLNICMSHQASVTLVNKLGSDYDAKVIEWRESLLEGIEEVMQSNCIYKYSYHNIFQDQLNQLPAEGLDDYFDSSCESMSDESISAPSFSPISSIGSVGSLTSLD